MKEIASSSMYCIYFIIPAYAIFVFILLLIFSVSLTLLPSVLHLINTF